jgi:hypothetical protein
VGFLFAARSPLKVGDDVVVVIPIDVVDASADRTRPEECLCDERVDGLGDVATAVTQRHVPVSVDALPGHSSARRTLKATDQHKPRMRSRCGANAAYTTEIADLISRGNRDGTPSLLHNLHYIP